MPVVVVVVVVAAVSGWYRLVLRVSGPIRTTVTTRPMIRLPTPYLDRGGHHEHGHDCCDGSRGDDDGDDPKENVVRIIHSTLVHESS